MPPTWARARRPIPFAVVVSSSRRVNCEGTWLILVSFTAASPLAAVGQPGCRRGADRPGGGPIVVGPAGRVHRLPATAGRHARRLPRARPIRYYGAAMRWEDQAENWLAWARTPEHD